ncbi:MAG: CDP-glucose 4,6-dehydratase [Planctomycetota bacterium]
MHDVSLSHLAGRSVFLTGHTGFKGSWLSLWLNALGCRVTGYALAPPTDPSHFELAGVRETLAAHYEADLRDRSALTAALRDAEPEVVLHLAAQSVVRTGYDDPHETYGVNVMGTAALLDAVRAAGRPCVVIVVTTDKVYENREHVWGYRETDALGGYDPYSASKAACDMLTTSYRRSFFNRERLAEHGVKLAVVRAGNVIGGGDFTPHALVPDLMHALCGDQPMEVRAPSAVRPWQHVLDCLGGYLALADRMLASDDPRWCDAWNFGPMPGGELPVRAVVETALGVWDEGESGKLGRWVDASDPSQPHEAGVLRLCIDKAMWELGWRPRWGVDQAIALTAQWYRGWSRGESVAALSRAQIRQYVSGDQRQPV